MAKVSFSTPTKSTIVQKAIRDKKHLLNIFFNVIEVALLLYLAIR